MTAMPQLVSLFNAVGGGAAALVAIDDFIRLATGSNPADLSTTIFVVLGVLFGSVTFSGSLIAGGKLQGLIAGQPIVLPGGQILTIAMAAMAAIGTIAPGPRRGGRHYPQLDGHPDRAGPDPGRRPRSSGSRWSCPSAARTCRS